MSSLATENESAAQRPSGIEPSGGSVASANAGLPEVASRSGDRPAIGVADIDYFTLNPREAHPMLAAVYETWRDGWRATLRELAASKEVRSNDFTRQDLIGVVLIRGECAAVSALRFCDLAQPMWLEDSYFDNWPVDTLSRLGQSLICISSNTLIAPKWRGVRVTPPPADDALPHGSSAALALKYVVFGLVVQQFASSSAELMVGVSRNDRSMDRLARDHGAQRIGALDVHGIESDICIIQKEDVAKPHPVIEELWSRRSREGWFPALQTG